MKLEIDVKVMVTKIGYTDKPNLIKNNKINELEERFIKRFKKRLQKECSLSNIYRVIGECVAEDESDGYYSFDANIDFTCIIPWDVTKDITDSFMVDNMEEFVNDTHKYFDAPYVISYIKDNFTVDLNDGRINDIDIMFWKIIND